MTAVVVFVLVAVAGVMAMVVHQAVRLSGVAPLTAEMLEQIATEDVALAR